MRLIDADELDKEMLRGHIIYESGKENLGYTTLYLGSSVRNAPTIEAEPVVHARWIISGFENESSVCSHCGFKHKLNYEMDALGMVPFKRCPECGSVMDEVVK